MSSARRRGVAPHRPVRPGGAAAVAAAAVLTLTGCASDVPDGALGAQPSAAPAVRLLAVPAPPPPSAAPEMGALRFIRAADGSALPDRALTPGASFADVAREDVCDMHYTHGVRQPQFNDKVQAFAGYGVSIRDRRSYRVDHLIPIGLGGNNAQENLWPQPVAGPVGADDKDELEVHLRALVCVGTLGLTEAQTALARDWRAAHQRWMAVPLPEGADRYLPPGSGAAAKPDDPVSNGQVCPEEGQVGRTRNKGIKFTCTRDADGALTWRKRY